MDKETLAALITSAAERSIKENKTLFEHLYVKHENELYGVICTLARIRAFEAVILKAAEQSLKVSPKVMGSLRNDVERTVLCTLILSGALGISDLEPYYDMASYKNQLEKIKVEPASQEQYAEALRAAEQIVSSGNKTF